MPKVLQSAFRSPVSVGGTPLPAPRSWDESETAAEVTLDRSPGQAYPDAVGAEKTLAAQTLQWAYDPTVFTDAIVGKIRNLVGADNQVTATKKAFSKAGNAYGKGETYVGTISAFRTPATDANSAEISTVTMVFQPSSVT